MHPFLILLVLIGLAFVFISYFISEKYSNNQSIDTDIFNELTDEGKQFMLQSFGNKISEDAEDMVDKVRDELSQLCNEKIIAVSEYSDQVLEKINQNHGEVVFMYQMLTEKENEIKALMAQMNEIKASIKQELQDYKKQLNTLDANNHLGDSTQSNSNTRNSSVVNQHENGTQYKDNHEKANRRKRKNTKSSEINQQAHSMVNGLSDSYQMEQKDSGLDHKDQENKEIILSLYKEGMTVIDIAKHLNLGQGEVKLVIDLYNKGLQV